MALISTFQQSGLSMREFCRQQQISTSTFSCYLRRHSGKQPSARSVTTVAASAKSTTSFLPVEVVADRNPTFSSPMKPTLAIELARGFRIAVERDFDESTLLRLLAVLGQA
jgi:hypothetical protein